MVTMRGVTMTTLVIFMLVVGSALGQYNLYMDSPAYCGRTIDIYDHTYTIQAKADVTPVNPGYRCTIVINSGYEDSYYSIQITQKMVAIKDCGVKLSIYEGSVAGGASVKQLSCTTMSTGVLYSKGGTITFELIMPGQLYDTRNDFTFDVKAFRDPDAPAYASGGSRLAAGAIVGIVIGIVILVAFTIILFWCYKQRKLPGMARYRNQPKSVNYANDQNGYTNSDYNYSKEPSLVSDAPSKKFYLEDQGIFPSIDSLHKNSLNGSASGLNSQKVSLANWNIHTGKNEGPDRGRGRHHSEADTERRYLKGSESRGRTQAVGNSPERRRRDDRGMLGTVPPPPPIEGLGKAPNGDKNERNNRYRNDQDEDGGMSGVKRRRQRNQNQGEGDDKRPNSGIFDNPDKEGYIYDYDGVEKLTSKDPGNQENKMLHELKRELERRQSMKEGKGENGGKVPQREGNTKSKTDDAPGAPSSAKTNDVKSALPETGTIDKKYKSIDQQSEIGDPDMISNPLNRNNPAIRASVSELRGSTSPGSRKKKRRKSHKKYVKADPITGKIEPYQTGDETSTEKPTDVEDFDRDSVFNDSFRLPKTGYTKDTPLPPEAMAPIFATDESNLQQYYPQSQYEMQNQLVYPVVAYDAFGNPVYGNPVPLSVAYSNPGYYVDQNGYPVNTQQQQQQPMVPLQYQSPMDFHPGMPGYTSTPSYHLEQTPHTGKHSPHHGRKKRTKSSPHDALAVTPGAPSPIVPAANILDDPRIPPPGTTLMNSSVDPRTGVKTSQVVWTDSNPDPTDPTGDNPQITRQTIVRVTARDTQNGQLPQPPSASLQQMTFSAAKQLKNNSNMDPAFLSPSKGQFSAAAYTPQPVPQPPHLTQPPLSQPVHASHTPERDNAAFYTRVAPPEQNQLTSAPKPVVHNSARNYLVRDKITLQADESEI